ncbi:MAG: hypothetical protein GC181_16455 [Bacteroidetes bacterium]|nr:hypothetical protein [Bacteroidota bacterium]
MRLNLKTNSRRKRALFLLTIFLLDLLMPLQSLALTGGPSQPEVQSFEPVGTSDMVDIFSGDFNYNIPLMDVNGYPINISYHAGASADEEASWVGLGWNINPGTINRGLNGLPDDMDGDVVSKTMYMKPNNTLGLNASLGVEIFGIEASNTKTVAKLLRKVAADQLNLNLGLQYNNYKGVGFNWGLSVSKQIAKSAGLTSGLSIGYSDNGGLDVSPSLSFDVMEQENTEKSTKSSTSFRIGGGFNSRNGIKALNFTASAKRKVMGENNKVKHSHSGDIASGMYSFGSKTYTPGISTPYSAYGIDFRVTWGTEWWGVDPSFGLSGSWYSQYIAMKDRIIQKPGYGFMYEQKANQSNNASERDYLLDFNRENELPLMSSTPYLPWTNHTFDMYSVAAQGVGGTYRLYRNDLPMVHDDYRSSGNNSYRLGLEFGVGNLAKFGANLGYNHSASKSGLWTENNYLAEKIGAVNNVSDYSELGATHSYSGQVDYEPYFFREVGELVPLNEKYLTVVGSDDNLYPSVYLNRQKTDSTKARSAVVGGWLAKGDGQHHPINSAKNQNIADGRTPRNTLFTYLTVAEKDKCLNKTIISYSKNGTYNGQSLDIAQNIPRNSGNRKSSHITEITVLAGDGSRHVFGIPAYNNVQVEMAFRVNEPSGTDRTKGHVGYTPGIENSTSNTAGVDGFYTSTSTPGYAHSYLLTGVLSPDYVDMTGDGISDDDLGSAVKMNYTRVNDGYKWRTPYAENKAKYAEGLKADQADDMGNIVYGEKELWYLHSIEGKTHIALFKISQRNDGVGVEDENGGKDVFDRQYRLDSIQLFLKEDLITNGSAAVPVKTVHFVYDYSLCPEIENQINDGLGKLTLKKIYFTYGNSKKGMLNAYKFTYDDQNASYHLLSYDRWGSYAPSGESPTNAEYPYTTQDQELADNYASMWNLTKIELPSGGVIQVEYESDDYAYVQDRRAMGMFKILGFGPSEDKSIRDVALYGLGVLDKTQYDVMYFELKDPITGSNAKDVLRKEYLQDVQDIQTTIYSKITEYKSTDYYEYIKSYSNPAYIQESDGSWQIDCGVTDGGATGWIRLGKRHIRDKEKGEMVNPIALSALQYVRMNLDFLIHPNSDAMRSKLNDHPTVPMISTFVGMLSELGDVVKGPNRMLMTRKFCRKFQSDRSWVRLNVPDKNKLGGGHRVKQLTLSDQWEDINSQDGNAENATYGQKYEYTTQDTSRVGLYNTISSGVAGYEPAIGSDENPFVLPHDFVQKMPGIPDNRYTFEEPIGECFMPGASVGYSQVKVSSIDHAGQNPNHRTGYQISNFYTAKDYPVKVTFSDLSKNSAFVKPGFSFNFVYGETFSTAVAGQGYTIELNDMHGKPKSNYSYDEMGKKLSGVQYEYQTDANGDLDNECLVIQSDGSIETQTLGVNIDFTMDFRKMQDRFFSADVDGNTDVFTIGFIPFFIPTILPNVNFSETNVFTAVATKVVRKIGLLKKTTAYKEGSEINTENLLYDGKTGMVLLTSVGNEFGDNVYNFTYPAHWAYDEGMGQAFQNWGLELVGLSIEDGELTATGSFDCEDYLVPGDICIFNRPSSIYNNITAYVVESEQTPYQSAGQLCLIDANGNLIQDDINSYKDNATTLRVIRSGRRNMASVSIGSVTCLSNPIQDLGGSPYLSFSNVLATSAVEYKDHWRTELKFISSYGCDTVASDFFLSLYGALDVIADSSLWQMTLDQLTYTDSGTYFPDTVGTTGSINRNLHFSNMDSCFQQTVLNYLDSLYGADLSDLQDSIIQFDDLYVKYLDTISNSAYEVGYQIQDEDAYFSTDPIENIQYSVRGYKPYVSVKLKSTGSSPSYYSLHFFWTDLIEAGFSICRNGNISGGSSAYFYPLSDTIYSIDSSSSLSSLTNVLDDLNSQNDFDSVDSDHMYIVGTGSFFSISFDQDNCNVVSNCSKDNVTELVDLLGYDVLSTTYAQVTAIVKRYDDVYDSKTLITDTVTYTLSANCDLFLVCEQTCYVRQKAQRINPYRAGIKGNWRPYKSWTYVADRAYNALDARPKDDGVFKTYSSFWHWDSDSNRYVKNSTDSKWVWTSEVTEYSPYGMELENIDPLGRYSAARYGYAQTLPVAVGSNMKYSEMWYDGFEEYQYLHNIADRFVCKPWEWLYTVSLDQVVSDEGGLVDTDISHSGNVSLRLTAGDSFVHEVALNPDFDTSSITGWSGKEYFTKQGDEIVPFRPLNGKFLLSAWVHETTSIQDTQFNSAHITIEFLDGGGSLISQLDFIPEGIIIEDWQRISDTFSVPSGASIMRIKYRTDSEQGWFDDLRIHPYNGNMKSYAYDYRTLRLMAELDENNYATFYEYDLEGSLVRVKKETERGIKTLQENRQHQRTTNP